MAISPVPWVVAGLCAPHTKTPHPFRNRSADTYSYRVLQPQVPAYATFPEGSVQAFMHGEPEDTRGMRYAANAGRLADSAPLRNLGH